MGCPAGNAPCKLDIVGLLRDTWYFTSLSCRVRWAVRTRMEGGRHPMAIQTYALTKIMRGSIGPRQPLAKSCLRLLTTEPFTMSYLSI